MVTNAVCKMDCAVTGSVQREWRLRIHLAAIVYSHFSPDQQHPGWGRVRLQRCCPGFVLGTGIFSRAGARRWLQRFRPTNTAVCLPLQLRNIVRSEHEDKEEQSSHRSAGSDTAFTMISTLRQKIRRRRSLRRSRRWLGYSGPRSF